jgi:hypothetical protein
MDIRKLVALLRVSETSEHFLETVTSIGEPAMISEDPPEYDDPEGATKYYSFPSSGILFGLRKQVLEHIHLYLSPHEGYKAYTGNLLDGLDRTSTKRDIEALLGLPERSGGGAQDKLIGYIHEWMRYTLGGCKIRFELLGDGTLRKITLS